MAPNASARSVYLAAWTYGTGLGSPALCAI
jgi:hypothetical protein